MIPYYFSLFSTLLGRTILLVDYLTMYTWHFVKFHRSAHAEEAYDEIDEFNYKDWLDLAAVYVIGICLWLMPLLPVNRYWYAAAVIVILFALAWLLRGHVAKTIMLIHTEAMVGALVLLFGAILLTRLILGGILPDWVERILYLAMIGVFLGPVYYRFAREAMGSWLGRSTYELLAPKFAHYKKPKEHGHH